jgi:tRNA A-37 threonylcarbamoyl transferase component Bud32
MGVLNVQRCNIFILHAIGYKHNDLQNTNLLTFGCNFDTIDQCKYYIIDFGMSQPIRKKPSSISDSTIIERMRSDFSSETLLKDYEKYLSEKYTSQYFTPELGEDLLTKTRELFQPRPISANIMENPLHLWTFKTPIF